MQRNQQSRREGSGLGGVHVSYQILVTAWESTAVNSVSDSARLRNPRGAVPPNLHPQRTIVHPPMLQSTSDALSVRWHSRITGEPHRTAAAGGVKGTWGPGPV